MIKTNFFNHSTRKKSKLALVFKSMVFGFFTENCQFGDCSDSFLSWMILNVVNMILIMNYI